MDTMLPKALILTFVDPSGHPRPYRVINLLKSIKFNIDLISYQIKSPLPVVQHIEIPIDWDNRLTNDIKNINRWKFALLRILLFLRFPVHYKLIENLLVNKLEINYHLSDLLKNNYKIIIVHDLYLLPLALKFKQTAKIIFDAREYYPRQQEDSIRFKIYEQPLRYRLCYQCLHQCNAILTVSEGLSNEYRKEFDVNSIVVYSTPYFFEFTPQKTDNKLIQMVHHGMAHQNRKLETMIELFDYLDERFTLDLYLNDFGSKKNVEYVEELKKLAHKKLNVRFCHPVRLEDIIPMLSKYDIGIFFSKPLTFNLKHCLPNKLFEFIQARLMIAIGPSPDMSRIIEKYNCGIVANDYLPQTLAKRLNELNNDSIFEYKQKSHEAAKDLNWEKESKKILKLINSS